MKLHRRRFLHLLAGAAALPAVSRNAWAQTYPTRPVRLIVGAPAGSSPDIVARLMGQWLSERMGQPFIIDNRPGAGSNIGAEAVVKAAPDGYTLFWATSANAINTTLYEKLSFDFVRDFAPVARVMRVPLVMEVNPSVPATTVATFIAYAKANPTKINMVSAGNGTPQHVVGELFKMMTAVDMLHVPYRGNPRPDLLAGQVQVMFDMLPSSIEFIRTGKLRALAVTTAARQEVLPDIPTMSEFVPGFEASGWQGICAPKGTAIEIVQKLNKEINSGLTDPKIKARLSDLGATPFMGSPSNFSDFIAQETEKWAKVVKFSGARPE